MVGSSPPAAPRRRFCRTPRPKEQCLLLTSTPSLIFEHYVYDMSKYYIRSSHELVLVALYRLRIPPQNLFLSFRSHSPHTPDDLQEHLQRPAKAWISLRHLAIHVFHELTKNLPGVPDDAWIGWVEGDGDILQPHKDSLQG